MHFEYVDIGTSDFETSLDVRKPDDKVILVEPLFSYLRNLPDPENTFKVNVAVSLAPGWSKMYYIPQQKIHELRLPDWVRGCNSLGSPHVTISKMDLPKGTVETQDVRVVNFSQLVELYDITSIGQLKTDTEGHDHVVLISVIDSILTQGVEIKDIVSEYKSDFNNLNEMSVQMQRLTDLGYEFTDRFGDNIRMVKKNESSIFRSF